ncbi:MAG: hypothetical protein J6P43_05690, partial [Succinivibrionaceae bacterium]|nr:hypothetical protein [Succinivibrionaceae bacterium]
LKNSVTNDCNKANCSYLLRLIRRLIENMNKQNLLKFYGLFLIFWGAYSILGLVSIIMHKYPDKYGREI